MQAGNAGEGAHESLLYIKRPTCNGTAAAESTRFVLTVMVELLGRTRDRRVCEEVPARFARLLGAHHCLR